jgi:hypothetical protein
MNALKKIEELNKLKNAAVNLILDNPEAPEYITEEDTAELRTWPEEQLTKAWAGIVRKTNSTRDFLLVLPGVLCAWCRIYYAPSRHCSGCGYAGRHGNCDTRGSKWDITTDLLAVSSLFAGTPFYLLSSQFYVDIVGLIDCGNTFDLDGIDTVGKLEKNIKDRLTGEPK